MFINSISTFRTAARIRFALPGGYPTYFICNDGEALCHDCAKAERRSILHSIADRTNDGWRVVALDINYEDTELHCNHCNKQIQSAYGE